MISWHGLVPLNQRPGKAQRHWPLPVREIHGDRWIPSQRASKRKMFAFDDVIMVHEHHFIRQLGHATAQFVRFAFTGVLSDHIDIHSGEKPFACAMRGERFTHTKTVQPIYIFKFEIKNSTAIA